jgi:pimeloyl-ACP methyl ester carboxylesterase
LQRDIENSELVVFPEAGHFPHIDFPEQFNEVAIGFLSR